MKNINTRFLKHLFEVYFEKRIKKIEVTSVFEKEDFVEKKVFLKLKNGEKKTLRYKHSLSDNLTEWHLFKNEKSVPQFLPEFLFGMKLKDQSLIYFLDSYETETATVSHEHIKNLFDIYKFAQNGNNDNATELFYRLSKDNISFLDNGKTVIYDINFPKKHTLGYTFWAFHFTYGIDIDLLWNFYQEQTELLFEKIDILKDKSKKEYLENNETFK